MRRSLSGALFAALAACSGGGPHVPAETARALERIVDEHWRAVGAPGLTLAVFTKGATWLASRGLADRLAVTPLAANARLRVGSITKTFTAAAILQLAGEGKLTLDDPIDRFVPGFALGSPVTIRRALSHTSGIFNYTEDAAFLTMAAVATTPRDLVAFALSHPRAFAPGASFGYSNTNYVLLGLVIEAADGRAFHASLRARFFAPLGLADTFAEGGEAAPGLVPGYVALGTLPYDPSWSFGTGSLVSSASDLCRWVDLLYRTDRVLPAASRALMRALTTTPDAARTEYGLGTYLFTRGGRAVLGHTGSTMGFNAEVFVEPERGDCVAVLSNDFFGETEALADPLWSWLAAAE